jgi:hypothetical protein
VGRIDGIVLTVSDGTAYASLPAFSLNVVQSASGSATVSWLPPTVRTDGTALTNLAGYEIRYGTNSATLDRSLILTNPGLTRYVIEGLTSGTWYFGVVAFDGSGLRSTVSNVRSKAVP